MDAETGVSEHVEASWVDRESAAWDRIIPVVYSELHAIAHRQLRRERDEHTLNTTALVHEAFLRLAGRPGMPWQNEAHFLAVAARVMRQVLIDYARRRRARRRSGTQLELAAAVGDETGATASESLLADDRAEVLVALDEALTQLAAQDDRLVRVVECRFFGGLTEPETAAALGVTARTVRRDWVKAKTWLRHALES